MVEKSPATRKNGKQEQTGIYLSGGTFEDRLRDHLSGGPDRKYLGHVRAGLVKLRVS